MASQDGKIRKDDLVESGSLGVYKQLADEGVKNIKRLTQELDTYAKALNKVGITTKEIDSINQKTNTTLKKVATETDKVSDANNKAASATKTNTKATENQGKANKGLTGTFQNLLKSMVAFIGVRMFIQAVKDTFELVKTLDSLRFAMKAVITDTAELGQTQIWLKQITNAYGAELVTTTERYIKFRAASIQAGLSSKDTQKIFESMTKAAGVLGLKTDELKGIYLALEQMISKGKVTTEELRRQLGERLPGAMDIMAKSLGVTTAELDNMMKKGEIISKDVLPKFAEQVEIAFGIKNVKKVETLTAAQSRLSNAWTNLIKDMSGDQSIINNAFTGILDFTTAILSSLGEISDVLKEAFKSDVLKKYELSTSAINTIYIKSKKSLEEYLDLQSRYSASIGSEAERQELLSKKLKEVLNDRFLENDLLKSIANTKKENLVDLIKESAFLDDLSVKDKAYILLQATKIKAAQDVSKETFDAMTVEIEARARTLKVIEEEIQALKNKQTENSKTSKEYLEFQNQINILEEERLDIIGRQNKAIEQITKNSEKAFEKQIEELTEIKKSLDITSEKYILIDGILQALIITYKGLTSELNKNNKEQNQINTNSEQAFNKNISKLKELRSNLAVGSQYYNLLTLAIKAAELELSRLNGTLDSGSDKEKFIQILDIANEFNSAIGDLFSAISDKRLEQIEAEIIAEENKYDRLLELAEGDKSQQESIQREKDSALAKLEKKRLKEEQKAAKQRKAQALIDIAINTAIGIAASTKTGPLGLFAVPIIAALGALQIATVLAQPIPQYKDGLDSAKTNHTAMINDGGKREFIERNGIIFSTPIKNAVVDLQKGDKVHKDMDSLMNASIMTSLANDNKNLDATKLKAIFDTNYNGLENAITKSLSKARFNNNIKLNGFDSGQEAYRNSQSRWS